MKKFLALSILVLICTFSAYSQPNDFELYRCSSIYVNNLQLTTGKWNDTTYDAFYLVSYDLKDLIVTFDNSAETKLYISTLMTKLIKKDADGKEYTEFSYFCHDQDNIKCHLIISVYTGLPDRIFKLEYINLVVILYTKVIKPSNTLPPKLNAPEKNSTNTTNGIRT
jgi:hypothetical protein